ncbi:MAG: tetratricopeptide repeat protein [Bacteroidetes bacterium]|nr:MAG: tetratricopeptide repeat protein [Bacteroidota bacterium]
MQTILKSVSFEAMKNLVSPILIVLIITAGCGNNEENSPYSNIYNSPGLKTISDSIRKFPGNDALYYRRANQILAMNYNFTDAAIYDLKKAWGLKQSEDYAIDLGYLLQKRNADSAVIFLMDAKKKFPGNPELGFCLAEAYIKTKKTEQALAEVDGIIAKDPANRYLLERKVSVLMQLDKKAEAIAILERLFDAGNKYVGSDLAFLLAEAKNPKVLVIADDMIRSDSAQEHAEPYYFKGIYYSNIGDKAKAMELFNRAIQNDKFFIDAWIEKGKTQFELKQIANAKTTFDKIIEISPETADAFYWRGKCNEEMGDKEKAKIDYSLAYALDKTLTEAKEAGIRISKQ